MSAELEMVEAINDIENRLSLPDGFVIGLTSQDDWSFVVKAHALLEAALTELVVAGLRDPRVSDFVERLNVGGRAGKLSLAERLNLLDADNRKFVDRFGELRNTVLHKVANVTFDLARYFRDGAAKASGLEQSLFLVNRVRLREARQAAGRELRGKPKPLLWIHVLAAVLEMTFNAKQEAADAEIARIQQAFGKAMERKSDEQ